MKDLLLRFLPLRKSSGHAIAIQRPGAPFRTSSSTSLMPVPPPPPPPDSDSDDDAFTKLEHTNWQRGVDAYHAGFGPLTSQAVPTLLDKAGFLVFSSFLDDQSQKKVEEESLLDVACGPGQVLTAAVSKAKKMSELKSCCCSYTVTGLDFSCNFIQLAKKNLKLDHPDTTSSSSSNIINFVEGDAQDMSPQFEDESFTAVTSNFGILHLSTPDLFLQESYRVLKPGGKLAFSAWLAPPDTEGFDLLLSVVNDVGNPHITMPDGPPFFRFSYPEEIKHSLKEAGFIDIDITIVNSMEWTNVHSSDQLYNILLEGTARTRELLRGQTKEETTAIKEELQRRYDEKCSITTVTGGTARSQRHLRMPAVISSGRKPL